MPSPFAEILPDARRTPCIGFVRGGCIAGKGPSVADGCGGESRVWILQTSCTGDSRRHMGGGVNT